jgi:hypothetical protein
VNAMIGVVAVVIVLAMGSGVVAEAQSSFEKSPVLSAKDLLAPELLKGPSFTVDDAVPVKDFLAHFTIRSTYGKFEAHGIHMLQVRVREIHGLAQLEQVSNTQEFTRAAAQAVARPVTSAVNIVMNPVQTIEGLPGGVSRMFDRIKLGGDAIAAAATAPAQSDSERAELVTKRVGSVTVDVLGYEKERRDIAKSVGVDPYTTNQVLSKKLTDMAWVAFSGRMVIQTAMSVLVPGSMAMSAVTITNTAVYDTPPGDLINNAQAIFAATGASDADVQALMKNPQYSLSLLTDLAMGVQRMQGVNGLPSVIRFAAAAKTQDETRFVAAAVNMLARYKETTQPLSEVMAPGPILGRTANGGLVVAAPVDYVAWIERISRFTERDDLKGPVRLGWVSGQFSPRARKEFEKRGWTVFESFTIAGER